MVSKSSEKYQIQSELKTVHFFSKLSKEAARSSEMVVTAYVTAEGQDNRSCH